MAWMCKDDALLSLLRWTCFCWNKPSFKSAITLLNHSHCLKSIWVKFWRCDEMWSFNAWKADQRPEGFKPLYTLSCTLYVLWFDFTLGTVTVGIPFCSGVVVYDVHNWDDQSYLHISILHVLRVYYEPSPRSQAVHNWDDQWYLHIILRSSNIWTFIYSLV